MRPNFRCVVNTVATLPLLEFGAVRVTSLPGIKTIPAVRQ